MTSQPVEANVVLTADNSQYDQAMMASAGSTNSLGKTIDNLGQKINQLSKSAGRKLLGITAADIALISGATAAWGSYEKQMSRLSAQSAIITRTNSQQEKVMKDYTSAVKGLRTEFGTTTAEAAKLVEVLARVTSVRGSRALGDISKVFVEMSHATGESSEGLATSLTNLQKLMGTPINTKTSRAYADTFTYLSAQTNISAQSLAEFTAQLAPVGNAAGMSMKQVTGFAAGFAKAGQDGFVAANVFNKMVGDITYSIQSGSPVMKDYARQLGISNKEFENLGAKEQALRLIESLNAEGGRATLTLQRLGLGSTREAKALQAVANQPGGLRSAFPTGDEAKGAAHEGADAAKTLSTEFSELRQELQMTAEALGDILGPAMSKFVDYMDKAMTVVRKVAEGPLGNFIQLVMGIVAPFTAGAGAILLFAGAMLKLATAFLAFRSSMSYGVREGMRGGATMVRDPQTGLYSAAGGGMLGARGAELARGGAPGLARSDQSTWLQRGAYNVGAYGGQGLAGAFGWARQGWIAGRQQMQPGWVPPAQSRGPLSYLAGGAGRFMQTFVNPQFDQMRFQDPTDRQGSKWMAQTSPWQRFQERLAYGGAQANVGRAEARLTDLRKSELATRAAPMDEAARQARLEQIQAMKEETKQRLTAARETERVMRTGASTQRELNRAGADTTTGFRRLTSGMSGFARGMGGGIMGAGRAGMGMAWDRGMVGQGLGMGAMVAGATVGSNALMLGGTGAMIGSMVGGPGLGTAVGAGIGGTIGLAMDVAKANDNVTNSIKALDEQALATSTSGSGIDMLHQQTVQSQEDLDKWSESLGASGDRAKTWFGAPEWGQVKTAIPAVKNLFEGIVGQSDVEEAQAELDATAAKAENVTAAFRDLAKQSGVKLTGSETHQRQQIEEFMASRGLASLGEAGIEVEDLVSARARRNAPSIFGEDYQGLLRKAATPGRGEWDEMMKTVAGRALLNSEHGKQAIRLEEDMGKSWEATNEALQRMRDQGLSNVEILGEIEKSQADLGTTNTKEYELYDMMSAVAQQQIEIGKPALTRMQGFHQQLDLYQAVASTRPTTAPDTEQQQALRSQTASAIVDQVAYFRQMLLAQDQYELSRKRAQDDYHQSRMWQEEEYHISRERAEESFNRSRRYAVSDFWRSQSRARYQFDLQRKRAEEDFNHGVQVQSKQAAQAVYDIYQRVQVERTSSAQWILSNAQDQLVRMQEQEENLRQLRKQGLSDTAIQQLGLTDPAHAQQLSRFVTEVTPQMIRQFNEVAGSQRVKAAKDLFTDPSSLEWSEMRRGFRRQMGQTAEDFERQMKESRGDFRRGLGRQREQFNIMMTQQAEDNARAMDHQETLHKKTMRRAAQDMRLMANEISLSVEEVITQSQERLTGHVRQQAIDFADSWETLKNSSQSESIRLMQDLAAILGFEYKIPKSVTNNVSPSGARGAAGTPQFPANVGPPSAQGGVLPGWTPGRDTMAVPLSGGEAIMRPEWARAVGEKNIDQMNHRARYGGFWMGGTMPLPNASVDAHGPASYYNYAADLNYPGYTDYGKPIVAWKKGIAHPFDYGSDRSYGRGQTISHDGQSTMYAHMSRVLTNLEGKMVSAGQTIGFVGDYGNTGSPPTSHLHFEIRGGDIDLGDTGTGSGATGARRPTRAVLRQFLANREFKRSEAASKKVWGVHPLFPGDITKVISRGLRVAWPDLAEQAQRSGYGSMGDTTGPVDPGAHYGGNAQGVWNALIAAGFSKMHAAGIMGNMQSESGFDPFIIQGGAHSMNPADAGSGGYGLVQWTPGSKLVPYLDGHDPSVATEVNALVAQLAGRGTSPEGSAGRALRASDSIAEAARVFELQYERHAGGAQANRVTQAQSIYDQFAADGAIVNGAQRMIVGESGPEAVIPLNARGAEFMAEAMGSMMGGRNVSQMRGGTNVFARIDKSTNFHGNITVQANDPMELIKKLQAHQRVMALSRPVQTGAAA